MFVFNGFDKINLTWNEMCQYVSGTLLTFKNNHTRILVY